MPNTAVKPLYAESTRLETVREDRELPVRKIPHLMDAEFFCVSGQLTERRGCCKSLSKADFQQLFLYLRILN